MSAPGEAGAIQPVEVRPKLRSSVRLVASVAWPPATAVAKRTQLSGTEVYLQFDSPTAGLKAR